MDSEVQNGSSKAKLRRRLHILTMEKSFLRMDGIILENGTTRKVCTQQSSEIYKLTKSLGRHEGYYRSTKDQTVVIPPDIDRPNGPSIPVSIAKDELINVEYSYKVCALTNLSYYLLTYVNSTPLRKQFLSSLLRSYASSIAGKIQLEDTPSGYSNDHPSLSHFSDLLHPRRHPLLQPRCLCLKGRRQQLSNSYRKRRGSLLCPPWRNGRRYGHFGTQSRSR